MLNISSSAATRRQAVSAILQSPKLSGGGGPHKLLNMLCVEARDALLHQSDVDVKGMKKDDFVKQMLKVLSEVCINATQAHATQC